MAIDGVTTVQGLQGGGTLGNVSVGLSAPVSLLNGGTGVSAFSNTQLVNAIGALPTSGGTMSGNLTVVNGVVVGDPPDGNLGAGTVNLDSLLQINASTANPSNIMANTHFHVEGDDGARILLTAYSPTTGANLTLRRALGNGTTPAGLGADDELGLVTFTGRTDTTWLTARRASIVARAGQVWNATNQDTYIEFETTTGTTLGTRLTISQGLVVGSPGTAPFDKGPGTINCQELYVNGTALSGSAGLPLTGGTISGTPGTLTINSAADTTPLTVKTNGGVECHIAFDNTPNAAGPWHVGPGPGGRFQITDESATPSLRLAIDAATGTVHTVHNFECDEDAKVWGDLDVVGDITGGTVTPSDRRIKKDIEPWDLGLAAVRRLNPISFQYNGLGGTRADGRTRIGLDADETDLVIPEMVGARRSVFVEGTPVKTISPDTLTFALVNAVKELSNRLEALERSK